MRCCLKKSVSSPLQPHAVHQIGPLAVNRHLDRASLGFSIVQLPRNLVMAGRGRHLGVIGQDLYPEM